MQEPKSRQVSSEPHFSSSGPTKVLAAAYPEPPSSFWFDSAKEATWSLDTSKIVTLPRNSRTSSNKCTTKEPITRSPNSSSLHNQTLANSISNATCFAHSSLTLTIQRLNRRSSAPRQIFFDPLTVAMQARRPLVTVPALADAAADRFDPQKTGHGPLDPVLGDSNFGYKRRGFSGNINPIRSASHLVSALQLVSSPSTKPGRQKAGLTQKQGYPMAVHRTLPTIQTLSNERW